MNRRALTLVEVLIVAAIVSVLTAVAVPNYLEAQTRAKVSATKNDLRTISGALEVYHIDHRAYPPARRVFPNDRLALFADAQLARLTYPIPYTSSEVFQDHFSDVGCIRYFNHRTDHWSSPNPTRSLLYFNYHDLAAAWEMPCLSATGSAIVSIGPDQRDSLGAYTPLGNDCFDQVTSYYTDLTHPLDTIYDPTNGTLSEGDIGRYTGRLTR